MLFGIGTAKERKGKDGMALWKRSGHVLIRWDIIITKKKKLSPFEEKMKRKSLNNSYLVVPTTK